MAHFGREARYVEGKAHIKRDARYVASIARHAGCNYRGVETSQYSDSKRVGAHNLRRAVYPRSMWSIRATTRSSRDSRIPAEREGASSSSSLAAGIFSRAREACGPAWLENVNRAREGCASGLSSTHGMETYEPAGLVNYKCAREGGVRVGEVVELV